MYYNWPEIFKEKSNKELYDIYCGRSSLPIVANDYAKAELEKRNFDLEDTKDLIVDYKFDVKAEEAADILLYLNRNPGYSFKDNLILVLILLSPLIISIGFYDVPNIVLIIFPVMIISIVFSSSAITNRILKKKISRLRLLEDEIRALEDEQNQSETNTGKKLSMSDFENAVNTKIQGNLLWGRNMAIIVIVILIAILIFKYIIK